MIDEATGDKILAAMALILRAQREDIDIIVRPDDLRVMIGMHTGQDQPKWLVNEMFSFKALQRMRSISAQGSTERQRRPRQTRPAAFRVEQAAHPPGVARMRRESDAWPMRGPWSLEADRGEWIALEAERAGIHPRRRDHIERRDEPPEEHLRSVGERDHGGISPLRRSHP